MGGGREAWGTSQRVGGGAKNFDVKECWGRMF